MTNPVTFELLGPVDLGRDENWWHWGLRGQTVALCGEVGLENVGPPLASIPGRCCPDCERIARSRGLL